MALPAQNTQNAPKPHGLGNKAHTLSSAVQGSFQHCARWQVMAGTWEVFDNEVNL